MKETAFIIGLLDFNSKADKDTICEVAWNFQAHVRSCCIELLGFKHKINQFFQGFPLFSFSTMFLFCQKVSKPKRNFMCGGLRKPVTCWKFGM